jgi:hypothetical protein
MGEVIFLQQVREKIDAAAKHGVALENVLDRVQLEKLNTIMVFHDDGHVIHWTRLKTTEQFSWLRKCFDSIVSRSKKATKK